MRLILEAFLPGAPVAQPRPSFSKVGGFPRAYVPARHAIHAYRQAIGNAVSRAARAEGHRRHEEYRPVMLSLQFVVPRPKSHVLKGGGLAAGAPRGAWTPAVPDGDNFEKGVRDAITDAASVWLDDCQIVKWGGSKRYAAAGETPGTRLRIFELTEEEAAADPHEGAGEDRSKDHRGGRD